MSMDPVNSLYGELNTDDIIALDYADKNELYQDYMSFVKGGALFAATKKHYELGDEVFLVLKIFDDPEKISLSGRVVWVTPPCAQGGRVAGIGVQFNEEEQGPRIKRKFEEILAGVLNSDKKTRTL